MTIIEMLAKIERERIAENPDAIVLQNINPHITQVNMAKNKSARVTFMTDALSAESIAFGTARIGIICWVDRDEWKRATEKPSQQASDSTVDPCVCGHAHGEHANHKPKGWCDGACELCDCRSFRRSRAKRAEQASDEAKS